MFLYHYIVPSFRWIRGDHSSTLTTGAQSLSYFIEMRALRITDGSVTKPPRICRKVFLFLLSHGNGQIHEKMTFFSHFKQVLCQRSPLYRMFEYKGNGTMYFRKDISPELYLRGCIDELSKIILFIQHEILMYSCVLAQAGQLFDTSHTICVNFLAHKP